MATDNTISQITRYFSQFPTLKINKGTILQRPGDQIKNLYFTKSGFIRIYSKHGETETTLNIFHPLFTVSYMYSISHHNCDYYIEALTPCEIWQVPKKRAFAYFDSHREFSKRINSYFAGSVIELLSNQSSLLIGNATSKVAAILLQFAFDYGTITNDNIIVPIPITHRIIATLIGLTRETTSIQMSKLKKNGVIATTRKNFTILNLDKLRQLSIV